MNKLISNRLTEIQKNPFFSVVIKLSVAGILIWASWSKVLSPRDFANEINAYKILDPSMTPLVALYLPLLELVLAFLLLVAWAKNETVFLIRCLFWFYLFLITFTYLRGLDISCGCFGDASSRIDLFSVFRNAFFVFISYLLPVNKDHKSGSPQNTSSN